MKRKDFTDDQRSQIFMRDKALCAFTGKNLWQLDHGIRFNWDYDWVDHIKPASKGGSSSIDNGILLNSNINYMLSNHNRKDYILTNGFPNEYYYHLHEVIDSSLLEHIQRFSLLDRSDWYYNRSLVEMLFAVDWLYDPKKLDGSKLKRDADYYCKVSWKKLEVWKKLSNGFSSLEKRGLVPGHLEADQKIMLGIRDSKSYKDILQTAHDLRDIYSEGCSTYDEYLKINSQIVEMQGGNWDLKRTSTLPGQISVLLVKLKNNKRLLPRSKKMFCENLSKLSKLIPHVKVSR